MIRSGLWQFSQGYKKSPAPHIRSGSLGEGPRVCRGTRMLRVLFRETEIFCRTFELMARSLQAIGKSLLQLVISPKSTFGKKFLMSRSTIPFACGGGTMPARPAYALLELPQNLRLGGGRVPLVKNF